MQDLADKAVEGCRSVSDATSIFTLERMLRLLPLQVFSWVRSQNSTSTREAGRLADKFLRDHELDLATLMKPRVSKRTWERPAGRKDDVTPSMTWTNLNANANVFQAAEGPPGGVKPTKTEKKSLAKYFDNEKGPMCFNCQECGHMGHSCPKKAFRVTRQAKSLEYYVQGSVAGL
jgi:hypothetical protein